ncbi:MAG: DDE-type integrase/transposase/recombinase [Candidatus Marinimicrobia bacterium]|nr:DDE-type integrase/transposase/recombinase [Candidatus Neomarinimicrobiota bacterium]
MNYLKEEKKFAILATLVEGNSINSTVRLTGVHKTTILNFLCRIGKGCEQLSTEKMKGLRPDFIQVDEIWSYIGAKERNLTQFGKTQPELGSVYTYVALDAETRLVPLFLSAKRGTEATNQFMFELARRLKGRFQLTTDGYIPYMDAVEAAFGGRIHYAQIVKSYGGGEDRRYSPPDAPIINRLVLSGTPCKEHISTSLVERQNLTMRMRMRRFTRLTNGFSRKLENLRAAVALHFAHYNFIRIHQALQVTPAMAAGITSNLWSFKDLLAWEEKY